MNDHDHEGFEAELRQLTPARLPEDLAARLATLQPAEVQSAKPVRPPVSLMDSWRRWLWWQAPATILVLLLVAAFWFSLRPMAKQPAPGLAASQPSPKPDDVQIDRQLVAAYDALAQLPGGEPVRVRCEEWMDEVVVRDAARGVEIEHRTPRLEIVSVSLDTF